MACNQAPLVAPIAPIEVANCLEAVEINAEVSDVDGAVESRGPLSGLFDVEGADTATVRIAAGDTSLALACNWSLRQLRRCLDGRGQRGLYG